MSLLIRGLDMPKDDDMNITITKDGRIYWDNKFHMIAQAVNISTPHGRLIDADALFQDLREHNIPFNNDINSAINVAPTILEAER